jgi:hypothetical protein
MALPNHIEGLVEQVLSLSCDEQYEFAQRVAANVGYVLSREDDIRMAIHQRFERLEAAVLELNPGLNWRV